MVALLGALLLVAWLALQRGGGPAAPTAEPRAPVAETPVETTPSEAQRPTHETALVPPPAREVVAAQPAPAGMEPTRLTVLVVDASAAPVAGADVELWRAANPNPLAQRPAERLLAQQCAADGSCEFTIEPGAWRLRASHALRGCSEDVGTDWGAIRTQGHQVIRLRALGRVRGIVRDQQGNLLTGARVTMLPGRYGIDHPEQIETDATGRFDLEVPAEYPLELHAWHPLGATARQAVHVASGGIVEVMLLLRAQWTLTGTLEDAAGRAVAGATLLLERDDEEVRRMTTGEDGCFTAGLRSPGEHTLLVRDQGCDVLRQRVWVPPGSPVVELRLRLPLTPGIEGVVLAADGKPVAATVITAARLHGNEDARRERPRITTTDAHGAFCLRHLDAEATYELLIRTQRGDAVRAPIRAGTTGLVVQLDAEEQQGVDVLLELQPEELRPGFNREVELSRRRPDGTWEPFRGASTGNARAGEPIPLHGLIPGETYVARVRAYGFRHAMSQPFVAARGLAIPLPIPRQATLVVDLRDAAGNPIVDAPLEQRPGEEPRAFAARVTESKAQRHVLRFVRIDTPVEDGAREHYTSMLQRPIPLPPGRYRIEVTTPVGRVQSTEITLTSGQRATQTILLR